MAKQTVLILACGAIAPELIELQKRNQWTHITLQCLPASLHNKPQLIPAAVRDALEKYTVQYPYVFVAYADCGTGGMLDKVLQDFGVERLPGAHCYEIFSGSEVFKQISEEEIGTYYLTDFLVRHFDRLVKQGLGLDRHPELLPLYFGQYKKVAYLAQQYTEKLASLARQHAQYLGLEYTEYRTGLAPINLVMKTHIDAQK